MKTDLPKLETTSYEQLQNHIHKLLKIPQSTKSLFQYTNINALFDGILIKNPEKKGEEICIWASNSLYLNDPEEIKIGASLYDNLVDGNPPIYLTEEEKKIGNKNQGDNYFTSSFTTSRDNLPMWGMYGKNGSGISLEFEAKAMQKLYKENLYRCIYFDKRQRDKFASLITNCKGEYPIANSDDDPAYGLALLLLIIWAIYHENSTVKDIKLSLEAMLSAYIKDPAYAYEQEVRLLIEKTDRNNIEYRCHNNLIIPYIKIYFPKSALKKIHIGPTNDMERTIKSVRTYLVYTGFDHVDVLPSKVPYRG